MMRAALQLLALCICLVLSSGFYIPGIAPRDYEEGAILIFLVAGNFG